VHVGLGMRWGTRKHLHTRIPNSMTLDDWRKLRIDGDGLNVIALMRGRCE
jgi:hypothetical protein